MPIADRTPESKETSLVGGDERSPDMKTTAACGRLQGAALG